MAVTVKTRKEIELMREANHRLEKVFDGMAKMVRPGVSTLEIDMEARRLIKELGGTPNFLNYDGFPGAVCTSINEQVCHGTESGDRKHIEAEQKQGFNHRRRNPAYRRTELYRIFHHERKAREQSELPYPRRLCGKRPWSIWRRKSDTPSTRP